MDTERNHSLLGFPLFICEQTEISAERLFAQKRPRGNAAESKGDFVSRFNPAALKELAQSYFGERTPEYHVGTFAGHSPGWAKIVERLPIGRLNRDGLALADATWIVEDWYRNVRTYHTIIKVTNDLYHGVGIAIIRFPLLTGRKWHTDGTGFATRFNAGKTTFKPNEQASKWIMRTCARTGPLYYSGQVLADPYVSPG